MHTGAGISMQHSVLIANRGEIAIRVARACADLRITSVAIYSADDVQSLHVRRADKAMPLPGLGAGAYLDIAAVVKAATDAGCTAVHPGYGFLSESAAFARACSAAGLEFIGPSAEVLQLFGDKASARQAAERSNVPLLRGTAGAVDVAGATAFFETLGGRGMMVKAVAGGGGRGMREVHHQKDIAEAHTRASAEALGAFGLGDVYCEELIADARHIEVQVLGDGNGNVMHFGERECSLQRRRQKVVEVAPSPSLNEDLRQSIIGAALRMARMSNYRGLGTFEFLVDRQAPGRFIFIETNPRVQVEHTVTEEAFGVDLVQAQIKTCLGSSLEEALGGRFEASPLGYAVQLRVNMESMQADGSVAPAAGQITAYDMPSGPGVRVDGFGYVGYRTSTSFDSLLAKIVVHSRSPDFCDAVEKARRALSELRIEGVKTNAPYLGAILAVPEVATNDISTSWLDRNAAELIDAATRIGQAAADGAPHAAAEKPQTAIEAPTGTLMVSSPMQGVLLEVNVRAGDQVHAGQQVAVLEAMKMQHVIDASSSGVVHSVVAERGAVVLEAGPLVFIEPSGGAQEVTHRQLQVDVSFIRDDLAQVQAAHALTQDEHRAQAVAKRHANGYLTARENIAEVVDPGSFVEYGGLAFAAQRGRHSIEHLRAASPADGIVCGTATVNASEFGAEESSAFIAAYDYTVFAGTQGYFNHKKQDRIFELAARQERPMILYAEGGGGRPGDTDKSSLKVASLDIPTFKAFATLSGLVPVVGVANGRCFAGNAALLGCCDTIIATRSANIGLGGPAMIEGGGLGVYAPEEVGPVSVQVPSGVVDVLVDNERQAAAVVRKYLSFFQGRLKHWECADQRLLRHCVPENRLRAYDIRKLIETLVDSESVLELRKDFGRAMVTALVRIEGRPMGLIANNPMHIGGAIDADAADKAARFIALCDAHGLPVLSLCDTPGFMVGPEAEKTAQVRRVSRMFVNTATMSVPIVMVVLRKGYGLGALAMSGGNFQDTAMSVAWPTGEFGGMGLEGAVRLGYRKELEAISDPAQRDAEYQRRVALAYEHGKALNMAALVEIDDVIDPAATRQHIESAMRSAINERTRRSGRKRSHVETW
jgi:acetyl/propionyl-CoA carboxylase alpha subunit/acetyl-CoA carboxylase carboxyltransferase component